MFLPKQNSALNFLSPIVLLKMQERFIYVHLQNKARSNVNLYVSTPYDTSCTTWKALRGYTNSYQGSSLPLITHEALGEEGREAKWCMLNIPEPNDHLETKVVRNHPTISGNAHDFHCNKLTSNMVASTSYLPLRSVVRFIVNLKKRL